MHTPVTPLCTPAHITVCACACTSMCTMCTSMHTPTCIQLSIIIGWGPSPQVTRLSACNNLTGIKSWPPPPSKNVFVNQASKKYDHRGNLVLNLATNCDVWNMTCSSYQSWWLLGNLSSRAEILPFLATTLDHNRNKSTVLQLGRAMPCNNESKAEWSIFKCILCSA